MVEKASVDVLPKKSWLWDAPGLAGWTMGSSGAEWLYRQTLTKLPAGRGAAGARRRRATATAMATARATATTAAARASAGGSHGRRWSGPACEEAVKGR